MDVVMEIDESKSKERATVSQQRLSTLVGRETFMTAQRSTMAFLAISAPPLR